MRSAMRETTDCSWLDEHSVNEIKRKVTTITSYNMLALTLDTAYFRALRLGTEVKPLAYTDIQSPSAHPPAPLWCENMIPSLSSSSTPFPSFFSLSLPAVLSWRELESITAKRSTIMEHPGRSLLPSPFLCSTSLELPAHTAGPFFSQAHVSGEASSPVHYTGVAVT